MQKNTRTKQKVSTADYMVNQLAFHAGFLDYIKKEKSIYGKVLLQENLISCTLISLCSVFVVTYNNLLESKTGLRIEMNRDDLEHETIGGLTKQLKYFIPKKSLIPVLLEAYAAKRNKLTHRVLHLKKGYTSFPELQEDAEGVVLLGAEILKRAEEVQNELISILFF